MKTTNANVCSTDCRSEDGITVGMIDAMISIARVLRTRNLNNDSVLEALKDIRSDEDIAWILKNQMDENYEW